jgi:hypothetical protein
MAHFEIPLDIDLHRQVRTELVAVFDDGSVSCEFSYNLGLDSGNLLALK